jgi:hypothetical protein
VDNVQERNIFNGCISQTIDVQGHRYNFISLIFFAYVLINIFEKNFLNSNANTQSNWNDISKTFVILCSIKISRYSTIVLAIQVDSVLSALFDFDI